MKKVRTNEELRDLTEDLEILVGGIHEMNFLEIRDPFQEAMNMCVDYTYDNLFEKFLEVAEKEFDISFENVEKYPLGLRVDFVDSVCIEERYAFKVFETNFLSIDINDQTEFVKALKSEGETIVKLIFKAVYWEKYIMAKQWIDYLYSKDDIEEFDNNQDMEIIYSKLIVCICEDLRNKLQQETGEDWIEEIEEFFMVDEDEIHQTELYRYILKCSNIPYISFLTTLAKYVSCLQFTL